MTTIVGLIFLLACVFGGYILAGGKFDIILHSLPHEMLTIGGAAIGAFVMSNSLHDIKHALGGFMNVTAGVGGPALTVHATSERWSRDVFVGTGQVFLLSVNLASVLSKGVPSEPWGVWVGAFAALLIGAVAGHRLSRHVSARVGRILVLVLAAVGSAAAVVRGVLLL